MFFSLRNRLNLKDVFVKIHNSINTEINPCVMNSRPHNMWSGIHNTIYITHYEEMTNLQNKSQKKYKKIKNTYIC